MSDTETEYQAYVYALTEQLEQHEAGLDELSDIIKNRPLTFNERSATERSIQVLVEAAIGYSKHYLKLNQKPVPAEARASIERVYELLAISLPDVADMRGAIGMRNAIIHDYLNLEWQKIEAVLKQRKYKNIKNYVNIVVKQLLNTSKVARPIQTTPSSI